MDTLKDLKVAVLVTDGFEDSELHVPVKALKDSGARVDIISPKGGKVQGFKHHEKSEPIDSDKKLSEAQAVDYDAVLLPGGVVNADALRIEKAAQQFVREINDSGKPIAVICHGPWLLVSAGILKNRNLTSWPTLADDIKNAGASWEDKEVRVDGNLVSSRKPDDLPAFCAEMLKLFLRRKNARQGVAA